MYKYEQISREIDSIRFRRDCCSKTRIKKKCFKKATEIRYPFDAHERHFEKCSYHLKSPFLVITRDQCKSFKIPLINKTK